MPLPREQFPEAELNAYTDMPYNLARIGFDIPVGEPTRLNWARALILIQRIDDIVDSRGLRAAEDFLREARPFLSGDTDETGVSSSVREILGDRAYGAAMELNNELNQNQSQRFFGLGARIIDMRRLSSMETDVDTYAAYTKREAELTAMMIGSVMSESEQAHPSYPAFMSFLKAAGGAFNVLDSIVDLRADNQTGLTPIKPSAKSYAGMSREMISCLHGEFRILGGLALKPALWRIIKEPLTILIEDRFRGARERAVSK